MKYVSQDFAGDQRKIVLLRSAQSWRRGSNENTNGLSAAVLPQRAPTSVYSQAQLDNVALKLNQRPRAVGLSNSSKHMLALRRLVENAGIHCRSGV
jgi:IS30 family transposase